MPFLTITENGMSQLIVGSKKIQGLLPPTRKNLLGELGVIHGDATVRAAHIITGRTVGSFHVSQFTDKFIEFQAMWGAKWEEKRGGAHALMTIGINKVRQEAAKIAQAYYTDVIKQNIGVGGTGRVKQPTKYISKYMKGGRWHYVY